MLGPIVLDPLEWLLTRSYYIARLPQLNFFRDYEATKMAPYYCNYNGNLRNYKWGDVAIVMPPANDRPHNYDLIIAVEGYSVALLRRWGLKPDIVVTDFDFMPEEIVSGDFLVLGHAHGDNIDKYKTWAGRVRKLLPTVQTWPVGCSLLVPGFTDGDRAVYLAYYMGARRIDIYGFNPTKPIKRNDYVKRVKLEIAEYFISRVSRRVRVNFYP
ncbi:MAG: hypothetical protein ACP5GY_04315 [Vulcanisaeta sp.]